MHILRFTSGFNIECNIDQDIHVLQRALDHYVRIQDDPGLESTYYQEVEFSTGRVRLMLQELALIEVSDVEPTLHIQNDRGERHRLIMVATGRHARPDAIRPRSQHAQGLAMDIAVEPEGRPTHVTIVTRRGQREITSDGDLPVLRAYLEQNVIDGQQMAIPIRDLVVALPESGTVAIPPDEVRRLAAALINARQIEAGVPLRAIANVDGQDYGQRAGETLPQYEQRVIQDMMLRRGRDLMRERNLTPAQAAEEVHRIMEEGGVERLAPAMHMVEQPTPEVERRLAGLTAGDNAILARAIAEYYIVDQRSERAQRIMDNVGLTEPMIRWFNVQIVEGMDKMPQREADPTLMELWRD
jgi:hypothetical protein